MIEKRLESFGGYTTMHGFSRIIASKATPKRIAWIIVFVAAWTLFTIQMSFVLKHYFEYPKQVSNELVLGGAPFPAITFCNLGSFDFYAVYRLSKSMPHLVKFLNEEEDEEEGGDDDEDEVSVEDEEADEGGGDDEDYYGDDSTDDEEEVRRNVAFANETFATVMAKFYNMVLSNQNSSSLGEENWRELVIRMFSRSTLAANIPPEILAANSVQEDEFIVKCTYKKKPCRLKRIFDPYFFNCFTFTPPNTTTESDQRSSLSQGIENGLSVMVLAGSRMLKEEQNFDDDIGMPGVYARDSVLSGSGGVRVVIHPPGTKPFPLTEGYDVPPGVMASMGVSPKRRTRLGQPWGNCNEDFPFLSPEDRKQSGPYRRIACEKICIQKHIFKECGCYENTLPTESDLLTNTVEEQSLENEHICASDYKYVPRSRCSHALHSDEESTLESTPESTHECRKRGEKCSGTHDFRKCFKALSVKDADCSDDVLLKLIEKMNCAERVQDLISTNESKLVECGCHPSCNSIHYDTSYSLSQWPSQGFEGDAVNWEIFQDLEFVEKFACEDKKRMYNEYLEADAKRALKDFSKINVYISDANVLVTSETPAMTSTQLISDIGGQLGVWIGVSVITIAEVLEVLIIIIMDYCRKQTDKQKETDSMMADTAA